LVGYVNSLNNSGHPLPEPSRQFFEPRFGHDFSRVRIHADDNAARSARSINALAYTAGNHIIFDRGQYSPDSVDGKRLLAHELTHSIQQSAGIATAGSSYTRIMRQPNTNPPPQGGTHPSVMQD